jgi:uncharacterized phage infection (PIP) family protein YhgE
LLTVCSIFLCGLVATYVANAENFRQKYDQAYTDLRAAQEKERSADKQLREKIEETDRDKAKLNEQIASLKIQIGQTQAELDQVTRNRNELLERVNSFAAEVQAFNKTNQDQGTLLDRTITNWKAAEQDLIKERSQHKETSRVLLEKMAIIATMQEQGKRLVEEKTELQTKLDQFLRQYGQVFAPAKPVTPITAKARPAPPVTRDIGLKGRVRTVDLQNKMAEISIGRAHGVKEAMKFHVVRGDKFICDILILDVEPEKAVGILDLLQPDLPPQAGDQVSTNL